MARPIITSVPFQDAHAMILTAEFAARAGVDNIGFYWISRFHRWDLMLWVSTPTGDDTDATTTGGDGVDFGRPENLA